MKLIYACEWCDGTATHMKPGDWHLCDDCYNRRSRFEWLMYGIGMAVILSLCWLFLARV